MDGKRWGGHPINVFNVKSGMISGGGWDAPKDPFDERDLKWQKEMLENIPSCTLLMDMPTFQWWKKMCFEFGVEFEHHHFDGDLWTS